MGSFFSTTQLEPLIRTKDEPKKTEKTPLKKIESNCNSPVPTEKFDIKKNQS